MQCPLKILKAPIFFWPVWEVSRTGGTSGAGCTWLEHNPQTPAATPAATLTPPAMLWLYTWLQVCVGVGCGGGMMKVITSKASISFLSFSLSFQTPAWLLYLPPYTVSLLSASNAASFLFSSLPSSQTRYFPPLSHLPTSLFLSPLLFLVTYIPSSLLQARTRQQCNTTLPRRLPAPPQPHTLEACTSSSSASLPILSPGRPRDTYIPSVAPRSWYYPPFSLSHLYFWRCSVFIWVLS